MAENSKIEWTTHTFNPWVGCQKISPACEHCYAESWAKRTGQAGLWRGERRRTSAANWKLPLKWNKEAAAGCFLCGEPAPCGCGNHRRPRVFCSSLADVFEDHAAIDPQWRMDLLMLIDDTPHLDWLLLTKRPENITPILRKASKGTYPDDWNLRDHMQNVWIGTTVENQEYADKRIPELLKIPAKVRFLSIEPMLGPIDLRQWLHPAIRSEWFCQIHWVIAGGESGPNARPSHPDWFRSLRDQCKAAGVAFHFKQHGEWAETEIVAGGDLGGDMRRGIVQHVRPDREIDGHFKRGDVYMRRIGKKNAGRILDGRTWDELPS